MGYGSKALELLVDFYEGKFANLSEDDNSFVEENITRVTEAELANASLLDDNIKVRDIRKMPPLFSKLAERRPDKLDYVGVSYGLTQPLHRFWKRASFAPVYLRQTPNDLTGEHTWCDDTSHREQRRNSLVSYPMTQNRHSLKLSRLGAFARDFHSRFLKLLKYQFKDFPAVLALSIDEISE